MLQNKPVEDATKQALKTQGKKLRRGTSGIKKPSSFDGSRKHGMTFQPAAIRNKF